MSTPFWAIPAERTLRQTDALLACGVLQWFDGLCGRQDMAPSERLERLIRQALGAAVPAPAPVAAAGRAKSRQAATRTAAADLMPTAPAATPAGPGLPLTRHQRLRLARVLGSAVGGPAAAADWLQPPADEWPQPPADEWPQPPAAGAAAGRAAAIQAVAAATGKATPEAPGDVTPPPIAGRRTLAAAPLPALALAAMRMPTTASLSAAAGPTAAAARSARILDWSAVPPGAMRQPGEGAPASPRAETALSTSSRPADPARPPARQPVEAAGHPGLAAAISPEAATATRLVSGLPALQGLLQSALADSRQRHPSPPAILSLPSLAGAQARSADLPGPRAVPAQPAPALVGGLPVLDALGEEMLVDRLADRLQERLREQALREFGLTGGWV